VAEVIFIDHVEIQLRAELHEAERQYRSTKPEEKVEVRRRYLEALHKFSAFVFKG
jgi:hypothetical protein